MQALAYVALAAAFVVSLLLLAAHRRERQKELYRMDSLRCTRLYREIEPLLRKAASRDLDQVRVERDRVIFTLVYPPGTLGVFEPQRYGHRSMTPIRTRVLTEVIGEDLNILLDRRKYTLRRYRILRPNGKTDYGYLYTIRTRYKDSIMALHERFGNHVRI